MAEDLDDLIRGAMKTLDEGVPSGYFENLPRRALERLESSMDSSTTEGSTGADTAAPPITEDSGLHDIRDLARSTKERLSRRMSSPSLSDDQLLASSSAGWKVVALPEPAKIVSLPAVDELPSKAEVRAKDRTARKATKVKSVASEAVVEKTQRVAAPTRKAKTAGQPHASRGALFAATGVLAAAAAVAGIYLATSNRDSASSQPTAKLEPSVAPIETPPAPPPAPPPAVVATPPVQPAPPPTDTPPVQVAAAEPAPEPAPAPVTPKHVASPGKKTGMSKSKPAPAPVTLAVETKTAPAQATVTKAVDKKQADPSLDELLKEAGEDQPKKAPAKPVLANKALSGEDFKHGMAGVAARAQGCYKGTVGTAQIKLIVGPNGRVSKVTIAGQFAGKPEGDCVANAVKAATFPPWDGGPQTFGYSYLLSE